MGRLLARVLFGASLIVSAGTSGRADDCFVQGDNTQLHYRVFQMASPPVLKRPSMDGSPQTSAYFPGSDYATSKVHDNSVQGVSAYYLLWANRCIYMEGLTPSRDACRNLARNKGNGYNRIRVGPLVDQIRSAFSTYSKANDCTVIQALFLIGGYELQIDDLARKAGLSLFGDDPDRERMASLARTVTLGDGKQGRYLVDMCVLPERIDKARFKGIMLDYEVFDGRKPEEVGPFFARLRDVAARAGMSFFLASNPLPRPPNGLTSENARSILSAVDGWVLPITTGASPGKAEIQLLPKDRQTMPFDNFREQMSVLTQNGKLPLDDTLKKKLFWNVSLFDLSLPEADQLQSTFRSEAFGGIMLFRNFVKQGGDCSRSTNQIIACLAMGSCAGNFSH